MKETCLHALTALLVVFATGLLPVSAQNDATNRRPPVQTFYLPIPEEDLLQTLTSIHGGASWTLPAEPIESYNSIVVFVDGTVIYYDQWEDGYEQDIANPNHIYSASNPTGTQIWGDGDPSNGAPKNGEDLDDMGYYHMPATPPYNTVEIDLNGADARFFKIRVDNLADEVR